MDNFSYIYSFISPFSRNLLSNSNDCMDAKGLIKNNIDIAHDLLEDLRKGDRNINK